MSPNIIKLYSAIKFQYYNAIDTMMGMYTAIFIYDERGSKTRVRKRTALVNLVRENRRKTAINSRLEKLDK